MNLRSLIRSLIPDEVMNDVIMSRKPFTISAWVKGNKIVDDLSLWKRRMSTQEKITLSENTTKNNGFTFFAYEYDPKRGRQYEIIKH